MKTSIAAHVMMSCLSLVWGHVSCGQVPQEAAPADGEIPEALLTVDSVRQMKRVAGGESSVEFQFMLKNAGAAPLRIQQISTSCGCTTTGEIALPLTLAVQQSLQLPVQLDVEGKSGELTKSVFVITDQGYKTLLVSVNIQPPPELAPAEESRRETNQRLARANRQAIFRGDCAKCHATPAEGRLGSELYTTACGICHDAEHRAGMVPDLRVTAAGRDRQFWEAIITHGRQDTLMPAFAKAQEGILDEKQVASLVEFLSSGYPATAAAESKVRSP